MYKEFGKRYVSLSHKSKYDLHQVKPNVCNRYLTSLYHCFKKKPFCLAIWPVCFFNGPCHARGQDWHFLLDKFDKTDKLFFWEKIIDPKKVVRNWGFHKLATRLTVIDSVYIRVCGFGRLWICGFLAVKYFWKTASSQLVDRVLNILLESAQHFYSQPHKIVKHSNNSSAKVDNLLECV